MHLRVPLETQQVRKVGLNRPVFYVHTGMEWYVCERPDFWFTFPYHPNFECILERFAGFVSIPLPCVNATSLPTGLLEHLQTFAALFTNFCRDFHKLLPRCSQTFAVTFINFCRVVHKLLP